MKPPFRVIKLGGSLLDMNGLVPALRCWRAAQRPMSDVMLVGGGDLADVVRRAFARHALSEEAAHWLCIRLLGVTAELVARLLPEGVLVKRFAQLLRPQDEPRLVIFDPERFLREEEPALSPEPLPHTWDVTSDSIAARLARCLAADELVLLKSSLPGAVSGVADLVAAGYVDRYFSQAAAGLPAIRCVNLRNEGFFEITLDGP